MEFNESFSFAPETLEPKQDTLAQDEVAVKLRELAEQHKVIVDDDDFEEDLLSEMSSCDGDSTDQGITTDQLVFEESPVSPCLTFQEMALSKPLERALLAMGYVDPTPIQSIAIPVGLTGRDICGAAETGSGKTAAFLLPIVERLLHLDTRRPASRVLVLLPTRELAIQCHQTAMCLTKFIPAGKVRVGLVVGGEALQEQRAVVRARPDIIIATPGRLIDHLQNTPSFDLEDVEVVVLDEADRMLEEGFADELNEIIKQCPQGRQTLLFSATMTDRVDELAKLSLNRPVRLFIDKPGSIVKNLEQHFIRVRNEADRLALLLAIIKQTLSKELTSKKAIVFLPTKEMTHKVLLLWRMSGLPGIPTELHGSLDQSQRRLNLQSFKDNLSQVLLATDVAARGLDIPNVSHVFNYSLPPAYTQYCHRVGRTARAGRSGRALSLVGEADRKLMKMIIKSTMADAPKPKQRPVPGKHLAAFRKFLQQSSEDLKRVLKLEEDQKEIKRAEKDLARAEKLLKGETLGKPVSWFQKSADRKDDLPQSKSVRLNMGAGKNKYSKMGKINSSGSAGVKKPKGKKLVNKYERKLPKKQGKSDSKPTKKSNKKY